MQSDSLEMHQVMSHGQLATQLASWTTFWSGPAGGPRFHFQCQELKSSRWNGTYKIKTKICYSERADLLIERITLRRISNHDQKMAANAKCAYKALPSRGRNTNKNTRNSFFLSNKRTNEERRSQAVARGVFRINKYNQNSRCRHSKRNDDSIFILASLLKCDIQDSTLFYDRPCWPSPGFLL